MPIRREIQSFWWFRSDRIGGMAQPGFNILEAEPLTFDEELMRSFIAKLSTGQFSLETMDDFLAWWRGVVVPEFDLPLPPFEAACRQFSTVAGLMDTTLRLQRKMGIPAESRLLEDGETIEVAVGEARVRREVESLESHGFSVLVSLVENAPHPVVAESALEVHHLPVVDTVPPARDQVNAFADILADAYARDRRLVVHCMAGVGRTATMLLAGHLVRGEALQDLRQGLSESNPRFQWKGGQTAFLRALADEVAGR